MLTTLDEWQGYISQLAGDRLRSKAIAANTQNFADQMLDEGYDLGYVEQIVLMFVRQLAATGQQIPGEGAFDLIDMADLDPKARAFMENPMAEDLVEDLVQNPPEEPPDEVDEMEAEADDADLVDDWGEPL